MANWKVIVRMQSGQFKEVYLSDYNLSTDATQAALAQTGAQSVLSVTGWHGKDDSSKDKLQTEVDYQSARAISSLSDEVSVLSGEISDLRDEIEENEWLNQNHKLFCRFWESENKLAESEGRPSLSFREMKLMWGDPDNLDSLALFERKREGGRISIECPLCDARLRIPDGKRGTICCPSCQDDFYVDATHEYVKRPDIDSDIESDTSTCFIATAAFGEENNNSVLILRSWRDQFLLQSSGGKIFCQLYAYLSPPVAKWIRGCRVKRVIVRLCLRPVVIGASLMLKNTR